jgi:mono/diheme cytochrome c family protein
MKYFFISFAILIIAVLSIFGLRGRTSLKPPIEVFPDMDRQAKYHPQDESVLFADGRSDRPVVPGSVPFITDMQETYPHLQPKDRFFENTYLATGKTTTGFGTGFPFEIDHDALDRGQQQYNLFCAVCHGQSGNGEGVTKPYGMVATANLLDARIREMPEGEIFNTITNGKNTMRPYGHKIRVEDRWKVIAWLRTLQLAADAPVEAVPAEQKGALGL